MTEQLYSVEQVAERLGLHVRTIRNYVRDGKLRAVRIGKQYRISGDDLEAFTGRPVPPTAAETARTTKHSEVSSIVEIDAVNPETAQRIWTLVTAAGTSRDGGGQRLRVETAYDTERARMKVIILGGLADTARLLEYLEGVLSQ